MTLHGHLVRNHVVTRAYVYTGVLLLALVSSCVSHEAAAQSTASPQQAPAAAKTPAGADNGIEFSDKPNYSVAGVTDWTAVGGHGSDSTLRTSEELNREALALKAKAAATGGPVNAEALQLREAGDLAERQGNPLLAVKEYQRAAELDGSVASYLAWGTELLLHRAVWPAVTVLAKGVAAHPSSSPLLTAQGAALYAGARYDDAAAAICRASTLDAAAREPYHFAGEIAAAAPATEPCIGAMLERFQAAHPDDAQANYMLATYLRKQHGQGQRVEQLLRKTVALDPKCSDAFLQLGVLAAARHDSAGAVAEYQAALRADPRNSEAHFRLGTLYDRAGEHDKATAEYALHQQIDAEDKAAVEKERHEVQQFSSATGAVSAHASN